MGTGKTKALVNFLNSNQVPQEARVVIISFCKSFTSKLHKNIGPDFVNYQKVVSNIDANKVIEKFESLMRLNVHNLDKTILVLNESKCILIQLESVQMCDCDCINMCWIVFDNLIKNSAKVIAMDALMSFWPLPVRRSE